MTELGKTNERDRAPRLNRVGIVSDIVSAFFAVATITWLVVSLAAIVMPVTVVIALGIWTLIICIFAMPALAVLHFAPPRVPLKERNALFASLSWFGRAVWAGLIFALSIVIGAFAGVIASEANNGSENPTIGLQLALQALGPMILWPAILTVGGVAYIIMGIRWLMDLGAIISEDGGRAVQSLLEKRWQGALSIPAKRARLFDVILEFGVGFISRVALALALATVVITMALLIGMRVS